MVGTLKPLLTDNPSTKPFWTHEEVIIIQVDQWCHIRNQDCETLCWIFMFIVVSDRSQQWRRWWVTLQHQQVLTIPPPALHPQPPPRQQVQSFSVYLSLPGSVWNMSEKLACPDDALTNCVLWNNERLAKSFLPWTLLPGDILMKLTLLWENNSKIRGLVDNL